MNFIERTNLLYESGGVKRLHTVPTLKERTVAAHVYGAQVIAVELCALNGVLPGPVLTTLLYHDAPEVETGDIPAPTKRVLSTVADAIDVLEVNFYHAAGIVMPKLDRTEWSIYKAADYIDLGMTCIDEMHLGNRHPRIKLVLENILRYTQEVELNITGVTQYRRFLVTEATKHGYDKVL